MTSNRREGRSLEDFNTALQQVWDEHRQTQKQKLAGCSAEELKATILRLAAKANSRGASDPWDPEDEELLNNAAQQLGRMTKGEGLDWVLANARDLKKEVMEGWADADPASAFQRVAESTTLNPCSSATLMKMLQTFGDQDPSVLRTACTKVKWELFSSDDPFAPSGGFFSLPPGASVRPWLDSGAALAMKQEGVPISNLLSRWTAESPDEALAQWQTGSGMAEGDPSQTLIQMLALRPDDEASRPKVQAALDRLNPEQRERASQILADSGGSPATPDFWKKAYPGLMNAAVPAGEPK